MELKRKNELKFGDIAKIDEGYYMVNTKIAFCNTFPESRFDKTTMTAFTHLGGDRFNTVGWTYQSRDTKFNIVAHARLISILLGEE